MALKRLTAQEMVQLSAPWVRAGDPARAALEKVPLLAALLPQITAAHRTLFVVEVQRDDAKAKSLSEAAATLDAKHDELTRGIYSALTMLSEIAGSSDELLRIRDRLLPDGLMHTKLTYRGQAGHAALVSSRLDDLLRARLKGIVLHDKNLLDLVEAWLATAKELGILEEQRARISAPAETTAANVNDARMTWVRVVNALLANAELVQLDHDSDRLLFAALRVAERTGDGRRRSASERSSPSATAPIEKGPPANG
jgi:hypothetical protein